MYWRTRGHNVPQDFKPPTSIRPLTYKTWHDMAISKESKLGKYRENAYMRLDGCHSNGHGCEAAYRYPVGVCQGVYWMAQLSDADFLFDDLKFFNPNHPSSELYLVEPEKQRGIQCRFGAAGLVAEDHFDNARNYTAVLGGERRYILGHPKNCNDMSLYPQGHPLERHTRVRWDAPNLTQFPGVENVQVNEVVLQASDLLYLPTYWFHHIVSLSRNYQCNTRSGYSLEYDSLIDDCGFLYSLPN